MVAPLLVGALGLMVTLTVAREAHAGWDPGTKLTTPSSGDHDYFGRSLALDDGRILAGAAGENVDGLMHVGAAYVFSGPGYTQVARLAPPTPKEWWGFGDAVALDGNTAMLGESPLDNTSVHVFELKAGAWQETQLLHEDDSTFGFQLVLHGDTAVIGSPKSGADVGKVHVYRKRSGVWAEAQELSASDAMDSDFFSLSVAFDGETIVVGAPGNALYPGRHGVYVYAKSGDQFVEQAHLTYPSEHDLYFGGSVSVSGDTLAIGATFKDGPGEGLLYTRAGDQWSLQQSLTQPGEERFGGNAHVQGDTAWFTGTTAAQGSLYVYERAAGAWAQTQKIAAPGDKYGDATIVASAGTLAFGVNEIDTTGYIQIFANPAEDAKPATKKPAAKDSSGCSVSPVGSAADGAPLLLGLCGLMLAAAVRRSRS